MNSSQSLIAVFFLGIALAGLTGLHSSTSWLGGSDELTLMRSAVNLNAGQGHENLPWYDTSGRTPVYPSYLAAGFRFFGHQPWVMKAIHVFFMGLLVALTFDLARRLLSTPTAWISAALVATHPTLLGQLFRPMPFLLFTLFMVVIILLLLQALQTMHWQDFAWVGLSSGLFVLTRPAGLYWPLFLLLMSPLVAWSARKPLRPVALRLLFSAGVTGCVILPWTVRNYVAQRAVVPVSTHGSNVFFVSIIDVTGNGSPTHVKDFPYAKTVNAALRDTFSEIDRSRIFRHALSDFFIHHPAQILVLLAETPGRWSALLSNAHGAAQAWGDIWGLNSFFKPDRLIWLFPIGLWLGYRQGNRQILLLALPLAFLLGTHMLALATARYRLPITPFVMILGTFTITEATKRLWNRWRRRPRSA